MPARFPVGRLVAVAWMAASAAASLSAAAPPPLVVFHGPPGAPPEVAAARTAIAEAARANGAPFLDLSPESPPPAAARARLARAIDAYDAFRLDEALPLLDAALADAAATGAAGLSPADLSDLRLYRALVLTQRGDSAAAWEELVRAATLEPARVLDPLRFPPRAVEAFGRAAGAVAGRPAGSLIVEVPAACALSVDGRAATPGGPLPLATGEHYVRVECAGSLPLGAVVELPAGELVFRPRPRAVTPPTDAELVALARSRGAGAILAGVASCSTDAPPTLRLRLLDAARGVPRAEALLDAGAAPGAGAATRRLIDAVLRPVPLDVGDPAPPARRPAAWFRRPWVWAVVGAAASAAVLVPLVAVDRGAPTTFDVELGP